MTFLFLPTPSCEGSLHTGSRGPGQCYQTRGVDLRGQFSQKRSASPEGTVLSGEGSRGDSSPRRGEPAPREQFSQERGTSPKWAVLTGEGTPGDSFLRTGNPSPEGTAFPGGDLSLEWTVPSGEGTLGSRPRNRHALTFISIKSGGTEGHTGVHLLMVVEATAAGQALRGAPARASLAPLVAPAAAAGCGVPKVAQRARTHALPVGADTEKTIPLGPVPTCTGAQGGVGQGGQGDPSASPGGS